MVKTIIGIRKKHLKSYGLRGKWKNECRIWLKNRFESNWKNRRFYWKKFDEKTLTLQDVKDILSNIDVNHLKREYDKDKEHYIDRFQNGAFTETDLDDLFKLAFHDTITIEQMILGKISPGDPDNKTDWSLAQSMLHEYRRAFDDVWILFWERPEIKVYADKEEELDPKTMEMLWSRCMDFCIEWQIYPLYHIGNGWYGLLPFTEYVNKFNQTRRRIASTAIHFAKRVIAIDSKLPFIDKLPAYDGQLAEGLRHLMLTGDLICPKCGKRFKYSSYYNKHIKECDWKET